MSAELRNSKPIQDIGTIAAGSSCVAMIFSPLLPPEPSSEKPTSWMGTSLLATRTVRPGFPYTIGRFAAHAVVVNTDSSSDRPTTATLVLENVEAKFIGYPDRVVGTNIDDALRERRRPRDALASGAEGSGAMRWADVGPQGCRSETIPPWYVTRKS